MHRGKSISIASVATFAVITSIGSPGSAHDTFRNWDGSQYIYSFGCPNTTTYGEVINVPADKHVLKEFSFWIKYYSGGPSMVLRAEVYAWNGQEATGSNLYESAPERISIADDKFHKKVFMPAVNVTPGTQYVLFLSIDKDFSKCKGDYSLYWGAVYTESGSGGKFFYQNNGGDYNNWTTEAWSNISTEDSAFKALLVR